MRNKEALKEGNAGFDQVVWRTPETFQEISELTNIVAEAHKELEQDETFDSEIEALAQHFKGLDTSLLGDDDG